MIKFNVGDTVAIDLNDSTVICYVTKLLKIYACGYDANNKPSPELEEYPIEFTYESVVANLGDKPAAGSVYGFSLEPYSDTVSTTAGNVDLYIDVKRNKKILAREILPAIVESSAALYDLYLDSVLPINFEVRPPKGKMAGCFKASKISEDTITLRNVEGNDFLYTMYHEFGHALYTRLFNNNERASWIKEYHNTVYISEYGTKEIQSLLKELKLKAVTISEFKRSVDEANLILLNHILKYIKKQHLLSVRDLDSICAENINTIEKFWPSSVLEVSDVDIILTEYAKKNAQEFWCESFAHFMTHKSLPSNLKKLVKSTVSTLAKRETTKGDTP